VRPALAIAFFALTGCASAPPAPITAPGGSGDRAAAHAAKMVGKPYRYGGESPSSGFDCSGLVHYSFRQAGVSVPRSTAAQLRASQPVRGNLRRGDLVFFDQEGKKRSHVGIYLGNGRFVHAPSSGKRVRTDSLDSRYWKKHFDEARRF
jgi:cell wall-associated NlpC family hydrolase